MIGVHICVNNCDLLFIGVYLCSVSFSLFAHLTQNRRVFSRYFLRQLLACLPHVKFLQPTVSCMHICVAGYVWLNLYLFVPVPSCRQDDRDPPNNCWSETAMFVEMLCGMWDIFQTHRCKHDGNSSHCSEIS